MLLSLAEAELVSLIVSEQVLVEAKRNLQDKLPRVIPAYHRFLAACPFEKGSAPSPAEVEIAKHIIHPKDASILAAAMSLKADFLVTLDRKHFTAQVARKSGLLIGTPGDFLEWFRKQTEGE